MATRLGWFPAKKSSRTRAITNSGQLQNNCPLFIWQFHAKCNQSLIYNIPLQCTYDKTLFPSHVQKTIYHSFDVTTMFKK